MIKNNPPKAIYFISNLLSTIRNDLFTKKGFQSLTYTMLKPLLTRQNYKSMTLLRLQYMAYKILPDIRSDGRRLIQKTGLSLFTKEFQNWLKKHKSKRSRDLLIARVDDTKSGRKYGRKIPYLQYLYDYVKKTSYKTHQLYVLMISIGNFDYIVDFTFKKSDNAGCKAAYKMLDSFTKRLPSDLQDIFREEVRVALDGFYGKVKCIEDFVEKRNGKQYAKYSLVVKSGGKQLVKSENGITLALNRMSEWMRDNLKFRDFHKCHNLSGSYVQLSVETVKKGIQLKLVLCRFMNSNGEYNYLLLMTNELDWHPFRVLKTYKGRWPIETMFRTTKQNYELEKYSFHGKNSNRSIEMFFSLRLILYMMVNQYRVKHTRRSRTSLKQVLERFEDDLGGITENVLLELFAGNIINKLE